MAIDRRKQFVKQPAEEYPIDINFGQATPLGADEITSATASAVKWPRKFPNQITPASTEILLSTTAVIVTPSKVKARIHVKGGTDDYEYKITVLALWNNGAKLEEEIFVRVREE